MVNPSSKSLSTSFQEGLVFREPLPDDLEPNERETMKQLTVIEKEVKVINCWKQSQSQ